MEIEKLLLLKQHSPAVAVINIEDLTRVVI